MKRGWPFLLVAIVLIVGFAIVWFEPHKLVTDETVNEVAPKSVATTARNTAVPATSSSLPVSTTFISRAHSTRGKALLLRGTSAMLRLEDFKTDNGPDLFVYLSTAEPNAPETDFDEEFVNLGELKGNIGNQNYDIPAGTDLTKYRSVVIWCRRFTTAFGAAPLSAS